MSQNIAQRARESLLPVVTDGKSMCCQRQRMLSALLALTAVASLIFLVGSLIALNHVPPKSGVDLKSHIMISVYFMVGLVVIFVLEHWATTDFASTAFLLLMAVAAAGGIAVDGALQGPVLVAFVLPILISSVLIRPWASFAFATFCALILIYYGWGWPERVHLVSGVAILYAVAVVAWVYAESLRQGGAALGAAQRSVTTAESRFHALFALNPLPVIVCDPQSGRIIDANGAATTVYGYSHAEFLSLSLPTLFAPHERTKLPGETNARTMVPVMSGSWHHVGTDGALMDVRLVVDRLDYDERSALLIVVENITEQVQAQLALRKTQDELEQRVTARTADLRLANAELERLMHLKDEFFANMSHELRTPLTGILALTEVLEEQTNPAFNAKDLQRIHMIREAGTHLLLLINDILDLAKINAGKMKLQIEWASVADLCQSSLRLIEESARRNGLSVAFSCEDTNLAIEVDVRRMKEILVNLLSNAVKFTESGGRIGLDANYEEGQVRFVVWDTGIGIGGDNLARIFQPFTQVDSAHDHEYIGTGLGLSLVKRYTELHGGTVIVESKVNEGSRFTVRIPCSGVIPEDDGYEAGTPAAGMAKTAVHDHNGHAPVILVAEDNAVTREVICEYLTAVGFTVIGVGNGADAVKKTEFLNPDLVVMDIHMPLMDGIEAIRKIRSASEDTLANTPIIALTALAMPGDRERCLQAGASAYVSKPFQMSNLASAIQRELNQTAPVRSGFWA